MKLFYILLGILLLAALKPMSAGPGLEPNAGLRPLTILMSGVVPMHDQEVP